MLRLLRAGSVMDRIQFARSRCFHRPSWMEIITLLMMASPPIREAFNKRETDEEAAEHNPLSRRLERLQEAR